MLRLQICKEGIISTASSAHWSNAGLAEPLPTYTRGVQYKAIKNVGSCIKIDLHALVNMLDLNFLQRWLRKALYFGMRRCVVWYNFTDISEKRTFSIFRVRHSKERSRGSCCVPLAGSFDPEDEVCSSEAKFAAWFLLGWRLEPEDEAVRHYKAPFFISKYCGM
jgi:hypothetical protein